MVKQTEEIWQQQSYGFETAKGCPISFHNNEIILIQFIYFFKILLANNQHGF